MPTGNFVDPVAPRTGGARGVADVSRGNLDRPGVDPTGVFEVLEPVPTRDGEVPMEAPPEEADGAFAGTAGVADGLDDDPSGAVEAGLDAGAGEGEGVEPDDLGAVIFGGGGATTLPELKSESKITTIPADLNGFSESLIEYRVC